MKLILISLLVSAFVISACSGEKNELSSETAKDEHLFSDQKRALDKAKGVEQMLQTGADDRQRQIDEQTQ